MNWLDERCPDCGGRVNIRGVGLWFCNATLGGGCGWCGLHAPSWYARRVPTTDEQREAPEGGEQ